MIKTNCEKHGIGEITEKLYNVGHRCVRCKEEDMRKWRRQNNKSKVRVAKKGENYRFIKRAKEVHGNLYSYKKTRCTFSAAKVIITCIDHGEFSQLASSHLRGQGCPICLDIQNRMDRASEFISKAIAVHDDKYGYDKVDYLGSNNKVIIECIAHGNFLQAPHSHIQGSGCPVCAEINRRRKYLDLPTILYYVKVTDAGRVGYKIGITTKSVKERYVADLNSGTKIKVLKETLYQTGKPAYEAEQMLLKQYRSELHPEGHSMLFGGGSEVFISDVLGLDGKLDDALVEGVITRLEWKQLQTAA